MNKAILLFFLILLTLNVFAIDSRYIFITKPSGAADWNTITNFPAACPPGEAISQLGATPICISVGSSSNPFDQDLNTTNDVNFNTITISTPSLITVTDYPASSSFALSTENIYPYSITGFDDEGGTITDDGAGNLNSSVYGSFGNINYKLGTVVASANINQIDYNYSNYSPLYSPPVGIFNGKISAGTLNLYGSNIGDLFITSSNTSSLINISIGTDNHVGEDGTPSNIGIGQGVYSLGGTVSGRGIAMGTYAAAYNGGTAIGNIAQSGGEYAYALGNFANSSTFYSLAIGNSANAGAYGTGGANAMALGNNAFASTSYSSAIGYAANAGGYDLSGDTETAVGAFSNAHQTNATALGAYSTSDYTNSTAIGYFATTDANDQVMLGGSGQSVESINNIFDDGIGNALINGEVTANTFYGDGSNLTSLDATHINGVIPIANGGTNKNTWASGSIPYASSANVLAERNDFNLNSTTLNVPGAIKIGNQSYRMGFVPAGGFAVEMCANTPNCGGQNLAAEGVDFYVDTRTSFGLFTIYHNQVGTGTQRFPFSMSNSETINIGTHTQNNSSAQLYVKPSVISGAQTKPVAQFDANSTWTGDLTQWLKNGAVQAKVTIDGNGLFKNINSTADLNAQNLLIRNDANIVRDLNVYRNLTNFTTTTLKDFNISGNIQVGGTATISDGNRWVINSVDLLGLTYTRCYTTYKKGLVVDSNCAVS